MRPRKPELSINTQLNSLPGLTYIHTYIHVCIEVNMDIDWPWGTSCAYIARAHGEVCKAARQGRDRYRRLVDDWSTGCVNCRSLFAMF